MFQIYYYIIIDKLISHFKLDPKSTEPLKNLNILDIGCGGGLLYEPLNRLGARISGIDASLNNIEAAKLHAKEMNLNINYIDMPKEIKNQYQYITEAETKNLSTAGYNESFFSLEEGIKDYVNNYLNKNKNEISKL